MYIHHFGVSFAGILRHRKRILDFHWTREGLHGSNGRYDSESSTTSSGEIYMLSMKLFEISTFGPRIYIVIATHNDILSLFTC
jgi:hypothetical protein